MSIEVRDMLPEDEYFVATCSHVNESAEADASGKRRIEWLKSMQGQGVRVKVGLIDGKHAARWNSGALPAGTYFCTLVGSFGTETERLAFVD